MRFGASSTGLTAMVRVESAGPPTCIAAPFGGDIIAGGWQPTVWLSKEPPAIAPTAFTRSRRENRGLGIGPPEQGRIVTTLFPEASIPQPGRVTIGVRTSVVRKRTARYPARQAWS